MGNLWPAVIGLLIGLPSALLGYLAYRRGTRSDKAAAQATISVAQSGSITQVIDGLNSLVGALQNDNAALRVAHESLREALDRSELRVTQLSETLAKLRAEVSQ